MRVPWLGDVLADAGLDVVPVGQPVGRGREMATVYGVVGHDTVTTTGWTDERVDELLRVGRSDLPGPLAQLGLDRQGRFRWIADGRCNHNGYGLWGNNSIGIEAYCAGGKKGHEEPWNSRQYEAFVTGARAILEHLDLGVSDYWNPRVAGHKETDPNRKIDPYKVDMDRVRRDVARQPEDDDMPKLIRIAGGSAIYAVVAGHREHIPSREVFNALGYDVNKVEDVPKDHPLAKLPERIETEGLTVAAADQRYVTRGTTVKLP